MAIGHPIAVQSQNGTFSTDPTSEPLSLQLHSVIRTPAVQGKKIGQTISSYGPPDPTGAAVSHPWPAGFHQQFMTSVFNRPAPHAQNRPQIVTIAVASFEPNIRNSRAKPRSDEPAAMVRDHSEVGHTQQPQSEIQAADTPTCPSHASDQTATKHQD
ncbi:hypothetical protein ACLOJK_006577 [Asimina triloba]